MPVPDIKGRCSNPLSGVCLFLVNFGKYYVSVDSRTKTQQNVQTLKLEYILLRIN